MQSRVRSNRVPEKFPEKVPEKVREALVQSQVRFNRVPKKVPEKVPEKVREKVPEKVCEALVQSQVRFNGVPEKVSEKVPGGFGAERGQVQQGSGEGFPEKVWKAWCQVKFNRVLEKVLGGFGAEPGQVQQGSGEGSGEGLRGFGAEPGQVQRGSREDLGEGSGRLWCRARSGSTGFREKVPGEGVEGLVQSQVKFNRVLEKVLGVFGAEPSQVQQGSGEVSGEGSKKPWCRAKSGSTGFRRKFRRRCGRL